jgi:hypothetical protein
VKKPAPAMSLRGRGATPAETHYDQNQTDYGHNRSDDRPHGMAAHAASTQNVEALQRPHDTSGNCDHTYDKPNPAHRFLLLLHNVAGLPLLW